MAINYGIHDTETPIQDSLGEALTHGMIVSNLAYLVAKGMNMSEEECHQLAVAGMVHDIGKLRLRSYVYKEKEA
ncbi:MAG: HDOD domain-containing protein, partial [Eubacterium sp.]|nr:HDOD domain-containing protein [Eubacterium sp.]